MKGDEWQQGMENEAASVTDARWARETLAVAKVRGLGWDVLLSAIAALSIPALSWAYWSALVNCRFHIQETVVGCWANQHLNAIDLLALLSLLSFSFALGWLRVRRDVVLGAFALLPIVKSLWPLLMPLLGMVPRMEDMAFPRLNMLDFVRFNTLTLGQMFVCPLLAWALWTVGVWWRCRQERPYAV